MTVNPATRLIVWILFLFAAQGLSGKYLAMAVAVLPFLGAKVLRRGGRMVWRTRWLLISLVAIFSWGVAGEPLWSGAYAPTYEGLIEGATHLGRLLLVLVGLAAIQETMPFYDLLAATYTLLRPLRVVGLDPGRGVVRLMLVLRYVEALPRPRDWRVLLEEPAASEIETLEISHHDFRWCDIFVVISALCVISALWLVGSVL